MTDRLPCDVPPNSSPLRELAYAIDQALALPRDATTRDERTYLRLSRDRARLVREIAREIISDPDIEDDPRDVMALVVRLRRDAAKLPDEPADDSGRGVRDRGGPEFLPEPS